MTPDNIKHQEYLQQYLHHINESDEISQIKKELAKVIENTETPPDEKKKAEFQMKLLTVKPL